MMRRTVLSIACGVVWVCARPVGANNFAATVIDTGFSSINPDYRPGMGQFVNNGSYNDPNKAVGAPVGAGTGVQDTTKVVSLGGFGGQIILAFDHDVEDDPANPFGLDAIVFGNPRWISGSPHHHWTEPAHIEIMPELNGDNIPGSDPNERWYLIPGSALSPSAWKTKDWPSPDPNFPSVWYPSTYWFPDRPDAYTTGGYELQMNYKTVGGYQGVFVNPNVEDADPNNDDQEGFWGYAEFTPVLKRGDRNGDNVTTGLGDDPNMPAAIFYTVPDDPFTVGITRGSCGGDAFDIQWAVDPENGWQPANLTRFRYIRITNAVDRFLGVLGEISTEIGGVSDVRPMGDLDGDQDVDAADYSIFVGAWDSTPNEPTRWKAVADIDVDSRFAVDLADYGLFLRGWQLHHRLVEPGKSGGQLVIRAQVIEGNLDPNEGYAAIKISAKHTGTGTGYRWFNGLRAVLRSGGGVWVDPNSLSAVEIVQNPGTLTPGIPPTAVQINTESDANTAETNWRTYGGSGQAVEYSKSRDTWFYNAFANFLDPPGPDDPNGWTFTATQFPNSVGDFVDLLHLAIRKKAGYTGSPVRIYLGGQWGLVGEAPAPAFAGLITPLDPNASGDTRIGVLTIQPLRKLSLTIINSLWGHVEIEPNIPSEPPYMYPPGTQVTLRAIPNEGRSFAKWEIMDPNYPGDPNHMTVDANSVLHLRMDYDWEVRATFKCSSGLEMALPLMGMSLAGVHHWRSVRRPASSRRAKGRQARIGGP